MKRTTFLLPGLLPRISDQAAVQLLDILEQLLVWVHHHYAPQIQRWQRRQFNAAPLRQPPAPLFDDEPF